MVNNLAVKLLALLSLALAFLLACSSATADTIYVSGTTFSSGVIEEFTSAGVSAVFTTTASSFPSGLVFDPGGNLYVGEGSTIVKFTPSAIASTFTSSGLDDVVGLAIDSSNNIYATNFIGNSVITKTTPGGVTSQFADSSSGTNVPCGLAFDSSGNLYAANTMGNNITKFTNGVGSQFASGLHQPTGLAFDSAGNLYVANGTNIMKFTRTGIGSVFASTGLNQPQGMAFDSAGNLYVANSGNNTIEKFTSAGVGSVFNNTLMTPQFIAVSTTNVNITKIIALTGSLALGPTITNGSSTGSFTIGNSGNTPLTVTSITYPSPFSGNWFGTVAPGATQSVSVVFSPTAVGNYSGTVTVNSDASSGTNTIAISGIGGTHPAFTSANTATFTAGRPGSFRLVASGYPASTFSTVEGAGLPSWATLDPTTGIITGTPPDTTGSPFFLLFVAGNGIGTDNQSFTLTVVSPPTPVPFGDWQTANAITTGPTVATTPDGLPNLLKYLFDIVPTGALTATDHAALPTVGTTTVSGSTYLTLTFRENPTETGITINLQTSSDLQTWTTVANPIYTQTATDPTTGDPILQAQVPATGAVQFLRLNVTSP